MIKKRMIKSLTIVCLLVMMAGNIYGCSGNGDVATPTEAVESSKEIESLVDTDQTATNEGSISYMEAPAEENTTHEEKSSSIAETEQTLSTESESQNEIPSPTSQEKSLCGTYELSFEDGGAELEIIYSQEEDIYSAVFSGSLGMDAGSTEGFLSAYTDGTDNIWEYYDNSEFDSGNYNPSFRLQYDGSDSVTVTSLDGQTFGGMQFPGFAGEYVRTAEYPMP